MNVAINQKRQRQTNFEILRTLSMLMIVVWHFYENKANFICDTECSTAVGLVNYGISQYIMILCSVAVNIYVMITGYFMVDKDFKFHRLMKVWIQTVFYTVLFAIVFHFFSPDKISPQQIIKSFLPIRFCSYWFVTDYFGLILIAPFLSLAVKSLSQSQYTKLLLALVIACTNFVGGYPFGDSFGLNLGYSLAWFVVLFFIGGYIKRFDVSFAKRGMLKAYFILGIIIWLIFVLRAIVKYIIFNEPIALSDLHYNSFPIILAVLLFLYFKNHVFPINVFTKVLVSVAPYTFGVYLIHENFILKGFLWKIVFFDSSLYNSLLLTFLMIVMCILVFSLCVLLDYARSLIFRYGGISIFENFISSKVDKIILVVSKQIDNKIKTFTK
jgi:surface polysaccharide O-acyltransferase-like enzyme